MKSVMVTILVFIVGIASACGESSNSPASNNIGGAGSNPQASGAVDAGLGQTDNPLPKACSAPLLSVSEVISDNKKMYTFVPEEDVSGLSVFATTLSQSLSNYRKNEIAVTLKDGASNEILGSTKITYDSQSFWGTITPTKRELVISGAVLKKNSTVVVEIAATSGDYYNAVSDFSLECSSTITASSTLDWATLVANSDYRLINNNWGKTFGDPNYTQIVSLLTNVKTGGTGFIWEWNWPDNGNTSHVVAFPEIIFGPGPWGVNSAASVLPKKVAELASCIAAYDISVSSSTGINNISSDIWLVSGEIAPGARKYEVMWWIKNNGMNPAGVLAGKLLVGGETVDLFKATMSDGSASWTYLALVPATTRLSGNLDVGGILSALKTGGYIAEDANLNLASVELGSELVYGTGKVLVNKFEVAVK